MRIPVRGALVKTAPFLFALLLSACAGSGHQLVKVSDADLALVKQEAAADKHVFKPVERKRGENSAILKRVTNRLLTHARPMCDHTGYTACFFQVLYNSDDVINAYASENYKIVVYRGLMDYLRSDDEVAAVVAHEMGHHLANHNQEKAQNAAAGALVAGLLTAAVLGAASDGSYYQQQMNQQTVSDMTKAGAAMGMLTYSVDEEREADLLGQYLLARSGYDVKKAERVLWLLMTMKSAGGNARDRSMFGDTHPAGPERIAAWRKVTEEIRNNKSKLPYKAEKK